MNQSFYSPASIVLFVLLSILTLYSIFTLLRTLIIILGGFSKVTQIARKEISNYKPLVSIIIPAWNEEIGITKTINSVLASDYTSIEVIVVDDGSTDKTWDYIKTAKKEHTELIIHSQKNGGKASALNHGISKSKGEIIVTVDADSYISSNAITEIVKSLKYENIDAASGRIIIGNTQNFWELAQYYEFLVNFHYKNYQSTQNSIFIITGAFAAYKRHVLDKCGEFDGTVKGEDLDYSLRMMKNGFNTINSPNAICVTEGPSTFTLFVKQRTRWKWCAYYVFLYRYKSLLFNKFIKSKYFSYIDFPLAVVFATEQLLFPLFWIASLIIFIFKTNYVALILFNILLPSIYMLLLVLNIPKKYRIFSGIPFVAVLFNAISLVEFIASCKAIKLLLKKQSTAWDKITRIGIK